MNVKALLVGINEYPNPDNKLRGCVNDVTNVRNVLKTYFGFENANIHVLVDDRATKARILERLRLLVDTAGKGDLVIFHYSGHGSQIRERNLDKDELEDGLDELICPVDMDWDKGTYILDDELGAIFESISTTGARLEVLLDCCHSYTGTKGGFDRPDETAQARGRVRFMAPPLDIHCRAEGELLGKKQIVTSLPAGEVCWAACLDWQTSADAFIGDAYHGAFTYNFCKIIRSAEGGVSRSDLLARLRNAMSYNRFEQIPQLECDKARLGDKVFS